VYAKRLIEIKKEHIPWLLRDNTGKFAVYNDDTSELQIAEDSKKASRLAREWRTLGMAVYTFHISEDSLAAGASDGAVL